MRVVVYEFSREPEFIYTSPDKGGEKIRIHIYFYHPRARAFF